MKFLKLMIPLFLLCSGIFAQDEITVVKSVAPSTYPAAARAVRASGQISVTVEIDSEGKVALANAFSGHPLLRSISVDAARQWQFSKTDEGLEKRTQTLIFNYAFGGIKQIEESEKPEETVLTKLFPTAFSVEVSLDTFIPRLLLLPREEGEIKPRSCDVHNEALAVEIQSVDCGPIEFQRTIFERSVEYDQAESADFPNANTEDSGCRNDGILRAEVQYCYSCRIARSNWIQINR